MAETAPTVNLNKAWLQNFLDNDVIPFADELRKMGLEGTAPGDTTLAVPALVDLEEGGGSRAGFLTGQDKNPIAIGLMAGDNSWTNGQYVVKALNAFIGEVTAILKQQGELFEEIQDGLEDTIEKLFKARDVNLDKIKGEDFLDFFEDVDSILSEGSGSGDGDEND
ncbi:MAG: type VII secretion system-associated protein [Streptomyces sp.]|uniref:type VII secretion system-associated protein n=1 Tax=Streptomyces sp. NBC_00028 TaxID=2975624 RepID=UPI0017E9CF1E|nr:type VII secretion system-associated protein [Streptomyces sp.]NUS80008.1 type VII secretion system-associated protein [Streptomyces sp.]